MQTPNPKSTFIIALSVLGVGWTPALAQELRPAVVFQQEVRPLLMEYCSSCHLGDAEHDDRFVTAEVADDMQDARSLWASVAVQLRNRTMPPADEQQPPEEERLKIAGWIETQLRETACSGEPFAGWVPTRRLNRVEYDNTIRDLCGVELGFSLSLPADSGGGEGFDNNGETLFLQPMLLERYLEASQQIVDACIVVPPREFLFEANRLLPEIEPGGNEFRAIAPGEQVSALVPAPLECDYQLTVEAYPDAKSTKVAISIDDIPTTSLTFRPYAGEDSANQEETRIRLTRGLHSITVQAPPDQALRLLRVRVTQWPEELTPEKLAIHKRLLGRAPGEVVVEARKEARKVLRNFATQAFRRPAQPAELNEYMRLYDRAAERDDPFEQRIKLMFKAVLVSPEFLFRIESPAPANSLVAAAGLVPLTDYELATRLSYFFWSTMPDPELRLLAKRGQLQDVVALEEQIDRMLESDKAAEFYATFVGQWLGTRDVGGSVAPTFNAIQDVYTPDIATDMRQEAVLLFQTIVREDRSLLELLDSDFQFMTGRLAKFYGVEGHERMIKDEFQRVKLSEHEGHNAQRGGVLGLGAVLAATSHVTSKETSPVLRGAWVLDTLLGTPVPPPPPDVPELDKKAAKAKKLTLRQTLEAHRSDSACAACHNLMDPLGFGLENFDFLGRWRDKDEDLALDVSGKLPSGEEFTGAAELKQVLLSRKREFLRQVTRKVLGYAIGRSLVDRDQCTIETIVAELEAQDCSAQTLIKSVVLSPQFRYKQAQAPQSDAP